MKILEAEPIQEALFKDLQVIRQAENYYRWIYSRLAPFLGSRILECGAGIGTFTELLKERELVVALERQAPCVEELKERFKDAHHVIPALIDLRDPALDQMARYRLDTVLIVNVLEHIEEDTDTLRRLGCLLQNGGRLAMMAPAFPWLYGSCDQAVGHYRRYRKAELTDKLRLAGFKNIRISYMNCLGIFGWFFNARLMKRQELDSKQTLFFDRVLVPWLRRVDALTGTPPWGLSLIASAQKG